VPLIRCHKCDSTKPRSEFYTDTKSGNPLRPCKVCRRAYERTPEVTAKRKAYHQRTYASRAKEFERRRIKNTFGLTPDDLARMLDEQDHRCAICGWEDPGGPKRRLYIDHCHRTGQVRGLLCPPCNSFLGRLDDDPAKIHGAATYLERWITGPQASAA
jgi:hypothetical protein